MGWIFNLRTLHPSPLDPAEKTPRSPPTSNSNSFSSTPVCWMKPWTVSSIYWQLWVKPHYLQLMDLSYLKSRGPACIKNTWLLKKQLLRQRSVLSGMTQNTVLRTLDSSNALWELSVLPSIPSSTPALPALHSRRHPLSTFQTEFWKHIYLYYAVLQFLWRNLTLNCFLL